MDRQDRAYPSIIGAGRSHIWPRYEWETDELRRLPVWLYPKEHWQDEAFQLGPQHDSIRGAITKRLGAVAHE